MCWNGHRKWPYRHAVLFTHTHREAILSRLVQGMWLSWAIVFTTPWIQWKNLSKFLCNKELKRLPETTREACSVVSHAYRKEFLSRLVQSMWLSWAIVFTTPWIQWKNLRKFLCNKELKRLPEMVPAFVWKTGCEYSSSILRFFAGTVHRDTSVCSSMECAIYRTSFQRAVEWYSNTFRVCRACFHKEIYKNSF